MNRPRIAIIGAGIAGLTAARHIRQHGLEPLVLEAEQHPGGRAASLSEAEAIFDLGAWTFTSHSPLVQIAREVGLANEMITIPTTIGRPLHRHLRVGNLRRPYSLVGTAFTFREALVASRILLMASGRTTSASDESAAQWAARQCGGAFTHNVLTPLANLYFLQSLDTLSRNALLETMRYLLRARLHSFRSGMGTLTSSLAKHLQVRCGTRVEAIQVTPDGLYITGQGFVEQIDGLIVATPLPEARRLLEPYLSAEMVTAAAEWPYAETLVIRLLLRGRWPRIVLQVVPPRTASGVIAGLTVERAKHADRVAAGYEAVTMYVRPERVPDLTSRPDEALVALCAAELEQWLGISPASVAHSWVQRWRHAAAFTDPGSADRLRVLQTGFAHLAQRVPIWAAGDFWGVSGLTGAASSAEQAARACLAHFVVG